MDEIDACIKYRNCKMNKKDERYKVIKWSQWSNLTTQKEILGKILVRDSMWHIWPLKKDLESAKEKTETNKGKNLIPHHTRSMAITLQKSSSKAEWLQPNEQQKPQKRTKKI